MTLDPSVSHRRTDFFVSVRLFSFLFLFFFIWTGERQAATYTQLFFFPSFLQEFQFDVLIIFPFLKNYFWFEYITSHRFKSCVSLFIHSLFIFHGIFLSLIILLRSYFSFFHLSFLSKFLGIFFLPKFLPSLFSFVFCPILLFSFLALLSPSLFL